MVMEENVLDSREHTLKCLEVRGIYLQFTLKWFKTIEREQIIEKMC